ncbi:MAG: hypothetical protein KatS3mg008_1582 [Acidimicrobiales bacterium]|nr:MAG: hypothetical protein KatS3mg008_1582 [Acidimicrobiales bacterium]
MVVVVGAGVAGLIQALLLAEVGIETVVLERDPQRPPHGPREAFAWDRSGVPQFRHSHALLARLREILVRRLPHVRTALLEAGASEIRICDHPPPEMPDTTPREGDEALVVVACRRTTFEWVLRKTAEMHPRVRIRPGVVVRGLRTDGSRVTGVVTEKGDIEGDAVVVAGGRRVPVGLWAEAAGLPPLAEERAPTGIVYLTRHYAAHEEPPRGAGPWAGDAWYLKYGVFPGDGPFFSVTVAVPSFDRELRNALRDPSRFQDALGRLPAAARWVDSEVSTPVTDVLVMGSLDNSRRSLCRDGEPVAGGLFLVGDAHTCTNPLYGRGCSLAAVQAEYVADLIAGGADPTEAVCRYESFCEREVAIWYEASVMQDRTNTMLAKLATGSADSSPDGGGGTESPEWAAAKLLLHGLLPASRTDPAVWRAFVRVFNLLDPPEKIMSDGHVAAAVSAQLAANADAPLECTDHPTRRELLAALGL